MPIVEHALGEVVLTGSSGKVLCVRIWRQPKESSKGRCRSPRTLCIESVLLKLVYIACILGDLSLLFETLTCQTQPLLGRVCAGGR